MKKDLSSYVYSLSDVDLSSHKDLMYKIAEIRSLYVESIDIKGRWKATRMYYDLIRHDLEKGVRFYAYHMPFINHFTPIEYEVWCDIRRLGLPFYAQYPVLNYFIDFADPNKKIAIECDGKGHLDRLINDNKRDNDLNKLGWKTFRIEGWKIFRSLTNICKQHGLEGRFNYYHDLKREIGQICIDDNLSSIQQDYLENSSEGILYQIAVDEYNKNPLV